ncbi:MAG: nucleotidyltransferase [Candidatus Woesearchaeota archaeon]|nr:MAG: nucleotidyltransferase [Candidatus Woesearchaeota archaeon]
MKLIIPLAGYGNRLRPHTYTKPKPLLSVAGKPILKHILDGLRRIKFSEVIFITGPMRSKIEEFVEQNYSFKTRYINQEVMNGNASAIYLARNFIREDVLILYADTLFDIDFRQFKKFSKNKDLDGIIWVKEVQNYERFGIVVTDNNSIVTKMVEKPKEPISNLANIGMYYIKDYWSMFKSIEYLFENNIKIGNEYYFADALSLMVKAGKKFIALGVNEWLDCGTFETLLDTNKKLLERNSKIYSKTKNSVIIKPVFIEKNVFIENSIIGPYVSVASGSVLKNSIVSNSIIDENARLISVNIKDSTIGHDSVMNGGFKKINFGASSQLHENYEE